MVIRIVAAAGITILAFGCASEPVQLPPLPPIESTNRAVAPVAAAPVKKPPTRLGTSVQGRPIEMHLIGSSVRPVLVLGGIHGSEPTSVTVAQRLLETLRAAPPRTRSGVAIIPVANPDGYAIRSRTNANKIDINRNFPAKNYGTGKSRGKMYYGGKKPSSEPETGAIIAAIDALKPRLIISIHSIGDSKQCNNYDGPASSIAALMSKHNSYPAVPTIGYPTPGSLGSYAGIDRQIPMITLELPRALPGEQAWMDNKQALLAAIEAVQ